ncbi:MAG: DsbA family protein [Hyphomicrobiaceae bacterium]
MTSSPSPASGAPQRGLELLPLAMVAAVAVMLLIAGKIDRHVPSAATAGAATAATAAAPADAASDADTEVAKVADAGGAAVDPAERIRIETVVRDYLLKNPEIMLEVQNALDLKMEAKRTAQMAGALKEQGANLYKAPGSPSVGAADANVTVVEFFDYNCGFCRRAMPDVAKLTTEDPKVKIVFKEFPIFGADSEAAAKVAIASAKQGKYWEVHKGLFAHEGKLNEETALGVAQGLGLDMTKLKADMAAPEVSKELDDTKKLAESLGIQGTPHFFVGEQVIPGAPEDLIDQLQSKIADVRKSGCSIC